MLGDQRFDAADIGFGIDARTVEGRGIDRDGHDRDAEFEEAELLQPFEIFQGRGRAGLKPAQRVQGIAIEADMPPDRRARQGGAQAVFVADGGPSGARAQVVPLKGERVL